MLCRNKLTLIYLKLFVRILVVIIFSANRTPWFGTWRLYAYCGLCGESVIAVFFKTKSIQWLSSRNCFLGPFLIGLGFGALLQLYPLLILQFPSAFLCDFCAFLYFSFPQVHALCPQRKFLFFLNKIFVIYQKKNKLLKFL